MSREWKELYYNSYDCNCIVNTSPTGEIIVRGTVKQPKDGVKILYWAANPANRMTSYSGSGLPYHNLEQAYDNSPNVGITQVKNGTFEFKISMPNSYYVGLGSLYIPPNINFKICDSPDAKPQTITIGQGIPFRTLTYPAPPSKNPRNGPRFYDNPDLPIRTQEKILRDSGYPCKNEMPDNFWGLRPTH